MENPRILVVDDDAKICELVSSLLLRNHMQVGLANRVTEAEKLLDQMHFDLIVLDVMMPDEDGTSFCRRLRATSNIPILMLSALGDDIDRIVGLEMGADDYLAKPFNPRELVARIKTILRRASNEQTDNMPQAHAYYVFDCFELYPDTRTLKRSDSVVELTSGEFSLLLALVEQAPRILSREQLLDFSRGAVDNPFDRSIDTHISRLRRKLEQDPRAPTLIKTVRNLGYAFAVNVEKKTS